MARPTNRYGRVDNAARRQSYILSVKPVDYSLTDGTNIPAPSPPRTPGESPAPGGGPLSSHPPSTASTTASGKETNGNIKSTDDRMENSISRGPISPASATQTDSFSSPPPPLKARGPGLRKLLSLNNLRTSFNASRTSLMLPGRNSVQIDSATGMKRPSSSGNMSTADSQYTTRSRRSISGWYKRRSSFFMNRDEAGDSGAAAGSENSQDNGMNGRETKRRREYAPRLPQISELGGGGITDGDLGWDESMFKK